MSKANPNPIVEAAFSDVPYILDSIWRWMEFRAYRLGVVTVPPPTHTFIRTSTTPWPFFLAYAVVSSLVVFGPTFTTLCQSFGWHVAEGLRILAGALLTLAAVGMLISLSYEISSRLVRRAAQHLAQAQPAASPDEVAVQRALEHARAFGATVALTFGFLRKRWDEWRQLPRSLGQVRRTLKAVDRHTRIRLVTAFFLLLLGAGVAIVPFALAGVALIRSHYDPDVCANAHHLGRGLWQVSLFVLLLGVGALMWSWREPRRAIVQLVTASVLWLVTAVVLYFVGGEGAREATGGPYPQTFFVLLAALLLVVFGARCLAALVMANLSLGTRRTFLRALRSTQLFDFTRTEPDLSGLRIVAALVNGVVYHPLHLLLLPSLFAVMLPTHWLFLVVSLVTAFAVMLLAHGSVSQRWEELIQLVQRWFLSGSPLLVSIGVITLAILRLFDVQYVSTILDAAPVGIIAALIVGAYMTLWFAEYWINRWIAERLLVVLGAADGGRDGVVDYPFRGNPPGSDVIIFPAERVVALQSIGEFCVQGAFERSNAPRGEQSLGHAFTIYRLMDLFDRLAPGTLAANDIRRRVKTYFAGVNLALLATAAALLLWQRDWNAPLAAYRLVAAREVANDDFTGGVNLEALLEARAEHERPALVVAASGGGTRAALYTATALQGLAQIDRTQDIVLLSGVSGGGVAVAYYASHPQLAGAYASDPAAWDTFKHVVTEPFIEDVLDGVGELRIAANVPLGELLAESFARRVFNGPVTTFSELEGPALILNTTISGHPWPDSEILKDHVGVLRPEDPCATQSQPFASLAGSRLIFTNARNVAGFPQPPMVMPDVGLDYKVIRDPDVGLAAAAALNANFPPVFSNARVRLAQPDRRCVGYSYFVTDGGATENLGLVSALYELRGVLRAWSRPRPPPQIDVIAIEASAATYDYTDDRGVGAATGGSKERINGALTAELVASLNARLRELGAPPLRLHYLPLPLAFRSRGGFGTHWMYADTIRVSNPLVPRLGNRLEQWLSQVRGHTSYAYLNHQDICVLWTALFDPHTAFCASPVPGSKSMQQVSRWICGEAPEWPIHAPLPDLQVTAWQTLITSLGEPPPVGSSAPARADSGCGRR